jgi:hypothetical protein
LKASGYDRPEAKQKGKVVLLLNSKVLDPNRGPLVKGIEPDMVRFFVGICRNRVCLPLIRYGIAGDQWAGVVGRNVTRS